MIAIVIGFASLFLSDEVFFKIIYGYIFIFLVALILVSYDFIRIKYWTYYSSIAIILTKNQAVKLFNDYNAKGEFTCLKLAPASFAHILQIAIKCQLMNIVNDKNEHWLSKLILRIVLKTGG